MLIRTMLATTLLLSGAPLALAETPPATAPATAKGKATTNRLSAGEKKSGWKLLFDGKTLTGWRGYKKQEAHDAWTVVDGAITLTGKGGDLITAEQYGDFELAIDWRISPKGNSGIIYRAAEGEGAAYTTGPEYQVLDDAGHPDANNGKDGNHKAGALYDVYPPSKNVVKPAGEWNSTKIVLRGSHVEHWLNGQKVVEAEMDSDAWKQKVAASKWSKMEKWATLPKGHIALQDHGDKVEYRNIRLRELHTAAARLQKMPPKGEKSAKTETAPTAQPIAAK